MGSPCHNPLAAHRAANNECGHRIVEKHLHRGRVASCNEKHDMFDKCVQDQRVGRARLSSASNFHIDHNWSITKEMINAIKFKGKGSIEPPEYSLAMGPSVESSFVLSTYADIRDMVKDYPYGFKMPTVLCYL